MMQNGVTKALDLLALALVAHGHQWTSRERTAYELAVTSLSRRGFGSSASEISQVLKPSLARPQENARGAAR